jgi:hypothetical protein
MPIHFEEVTGEIESPRRAEEPQQAPRQPARPEDADARLERDLRLREERLARLCDR